MKAKRKTKTRSVICAIAGSATSPAKAKSSRENGKLGGRPGNPEIRRIMQERGVSRQRAHQILQARAAVAR